MAEMGRSLRSVSDELLADLDLLQSLEEEKRQLIPGDTRAVELAAQIEDLAHRVIDRSSTQRELTQQAQQLMEAGSPDVPLAPIEQLPRELPVILGEWRDAERRLISAPEGSAEHAAAQEEIDRLREEYRAAHGMLRGPG